MNVHMPKLSRSDQRRLWDMCIDLLNAHELAKAELVPGKFHSNEDTLYSLIPYYCIVSKAERRFRKLFRKCYRVGALYRKSDGSVSRKKLKTHAKKLLCGGRK